MVPAAGGVVASIGSDQSEIGANLRPETTPEAEAEGSVEGPSAEDMVMERPSDNNQGCHIEDAVDSSGDASSYWVKRAQWWK